MKTWLDKYKFSIDEINNKGILFNSIYEKSKKSTIWRVTLKDTKIIKLESVLNESFMTPALPKFRAKLEMQNLETDNSIIQVQIKGNSIIRLFKYVGMFMFLFGLIFILTVEFENRSIIDRIHFLIGPILIIILMNFWNRSNIKKGVKAFNDLL